MINMNFNFFTNEIDDIYELIKEAFEIQLNKDNFILQDNQKILMLKNEGKVIGMSMITLKKDPIKNKNTYYLDYICIKKEFQHQSLGKKIFEKIIEIAKENGIDSIELTSNKKRTIARKIYLDYGMIIKDTDLFIKEL